MTRENAATRAAIYLRISDDKAGEALGVERQREDCLKLCRERGWEVAEDKIFKDNDKSAFTGRRREGYQDLIRLVERREVDKIVVYMTGRLVRSRRERTPLFEILKEANVALVPVKGPELDLSTATGRMVAGILGEVDTAEVEVKSERHKREALQRAERGRPHGGKRPFGISPDGTQLVDDEAEQLRQWYRTILSGGSIAAIATASGKARHVVRQTLLNPRYAGMRIYNHRTTTPGKVYPTPHPAVVSEETFLAVRHILSDPARQKSAGNSLKWFGSGLYSCRDCQQPVSVYYSGAQNLRKYKCGSCGRWWPADALDDHVTEVVVAWLRRHGPTLPSRKDPRSDLGQKLAVVRQRKEQLAAEYAADDAMEAADYKAAAAALNERVRVLEDQIAAAGSVSAVDSLRGSPEAFLAIKDIARKKAVIDALMTVRLTPSPKGKGRADHLGAEKVWKPQQGR